MTNLYQNHQEKKGTIKITKLEVKKQRLQQIMPKYCGARPSPEPLCPQLDCPVPPAALLSPGVPRAQRPCFSPQSTRAPSTRGLGRPSHRGPESWPSRAGRQSPGQRAAGWAYPSCLPGPAVPRGPRKVPFPSTLADGRSPIPTGLGRGASSGQLRTGGQFSPGTNGEKLLQRANSLCFRLIST